MIKKYFLFRFIQVLFVIGIIASIFISINTFFNIAPHEKSEFKYIDGEMKTITVPVGSTYQMALIGGVSSLIITLIVTIILKETALYLFYDKRFFHPLEKDIV